LKPIGLIVFGRQAGHRVAIHNFVLRQAHRGSKGLYRGLGCLGWQDPELDHKRRGTIAPAGQFLKTGWQAH
jgi:hypothetical protein